MTLPNVAPWPCAVCRREWRGFGVKLPGDKYQSHFCSFQCSEIHMKAARAKNPLTLSEEMAALAGGKAAGAYLDQIGKTDLSDMTQDEWKSFCGLLFETACADLARQADESIPF